MNEIEGEVTKSIWRIRSDGLWMEALARSEDGGSSSDRSCEIDSKREVATPDLNGGGAATAEALVLISNGGEEMMPAVSGGGGKGEMKEQVQRKQLSSGETQLRHLAQGVSLLAPLLLQLLL
ncbi:hypothetical protein U1Q18_018104 [Sarracenia purpurea var. burkii]